MINKNKQTKNLIGCFVKLSILNVNSFIWYSNVLHILKKKHLRLFNEEKKTP